MAETVSNAPWSNFKESDYTDEQWLHACLIDRGVNAGSAKQRASLPVREPNGTLNRNGVHAAAAALAGARGGLKDVSPELRTKAKKALVHLYDVLGDNVPASLSHAAIDQNGGTVSNLAAIMAIPAPLDPIRLVGDEEKHATLLFFGETSTLPDGAKDILTESVGTAASMLSPFAENVVEITRLGSDNPPALVAMLNDRCLTQIRNLFMMNPTVKGYLDNNPNQFPSFTPHVTLGFPDFAEEAILRGLARRLDMVRFDRLAVWWNDERIEYPLNNGLDNSLAMSDQVENALAHMAAKVITKISTKPTEHGGVHHKFLARGPKPKIGGQFDHQGTTHEVVSVRTTSQDNVHVVTTKKAEKATTVKHDWETYELLPGETLEHHGIKGMKWGVRRAPNPSTGLVSPLKPRTSSADQIVQDRITKKIKSGGASSLSNADIQAYTRRLQLKGDLERAIATQSAQDKARADGFVKTFLKKQGSRQFDRVANKAIDIAVEKALESAGAKLEKNSPEFAKATQEVARRLKPKKK
jgi:2'-5' RNA ligase